MNRVSVIGVTQKTNMNYISATKKRLVGRNNQVCTSPIVLDYSTTEDISFQLIDERNQIQPVSGLTGLYFAGSLGVGQQSYDLLFLSKDFTVSEDVITFRVDTYTRNYLDRIKKRGTEISIEIGQISLDVKRVILRDYALAMPRVYVAGLSPQEIESNDYYTKEEVDGLIGGISVPKKLSELENDEGFVQNVGRFGASKHIRREERRMLRDEKALLKELEEKYAEVSDAQKSLTYYRETMIRGTGLGLVATRLRTSRRPLDMDKEYSKLDLRVEKDLFRYCLQSYFDNVNPKYFGEYQEELLSRFGKDYDAMFNALWIDRHMTKDDGIYKFFADVNVSDFNKDIDSIMGERSLTALDKEYTQAKYRARKRRHIEQYPDANSTMRLTYGKVSSFKRDGKMLPWQTFSSEILAKENPDSYDFHLLPEWKNLLAEAQDKGLDLPVNFLTDNDITGGNSGSPVLNARGEIVGLAFDGNKESLASDVYWTPGYNKCVNVDIRFVLWTLENYAHCDNILAEIGQK